MKIIFLLLTVFATFHSVCAQDTFVPQNSGTSVTLQAIEFFTLSKGICVGANGVIRRTEDSGLHWVSSTSGTQVDLNAIVSWSENNFIAVGKNGTILKTTNFGDTWTTMNSGTTVELTSVFGIGSTFFVTCADGTLLKSTNNGNAWSQLGTNVLLRLNDVFFVSESVGYAVGNNGTLLKTTNGGNYWNVLNVNVGDFHLKSVAFVDYNNGIVCGVNTQTNESVVLRTSDAGTNWQDDYYPGFTFEEMDFADFSTGLIAGGDLPGSESAIFKTTSQGASWTEQTSSSYKQLGVCYINTGLAYTCGLNGSILRMATNVAELTGYEQEEMITVYPNPSEQLFHVSAGQLTELSGEIRDVEGRLLMRLEQAESIDLGGFESGIYFLIYHSSVGSGVVRLEKL